MSFVKLRKFSTVTSLNIFFSLPSFFSPSRTLITWKLDLLLQFHSSLRGLFPLFFRFGNFYSASSLALSSVLFIPLLNQSIEFKMFSYCIFQFQNFYLVLLYMFCCWIFFFFNKVCFKCVCDCWNIWNIFMVMAAIKSFSGNSNSCYLHVGICWSSFSFKLQFPWFSVWWVIFFFNWNLDILGMLWWDSVSYFNHLFYLASSDTALMGEEEFCIAIVGWRSKLRFPIQCPLTP